MLEMLWFYMTSEVFRPFGKLLHTAMFNFARKICAIVIAFVAEEACSCDFIVLNQTYPESIFVREKYI